MPEITIGKLAKDAGVSIVTVRYYERVGLLPTAKRSSNDYRYYPDSLVNRILFIKNAKMVGFSLIEIKALLELEDINPKQSHAVRAQVANKLSEVNDKIITLQNIAEQLAQLLKICDGNMPVHQCPIMHHLKHAGE